MLMLLGKLWSKKIYPILLEATGVLIVVVFVVFVIVLIVVPIVVAGHIAVSFGL